MTCPDSEACRRAGAPPGTCALPRVPAARASCNWMGWVQRVQQRYRVGPDGDQSLDHRAPECPARDGAGRLGAQGLGAGVDPQQPAWLEGLQTESFERRTPASVSNPVRPGYTLAYGITGPEGDPAGREGKRAGPG